MSKIAVLNFSGNVGKTTLVAHLLKPRMPEAKVFSVESINEGVESYKVEAETLRGEHFNKLFRELMLLDDAIVDVGASNVESLMSKLVGLDEGYEEVDMFIVPVVSGNKEMKESYKTIQALSNMGVPKDNIHVVFNRVIADVNDEFEPFIRLAQRENLCVVNLDAMIFENEMFDLLSNQNMTLTDALNDKANYRQLLREIHADRTLNGDSDKKRVEFNRLSDLAMLQRMAKAVEGNFELCYKALMSTRLKNITAKPDVAKKADVK